MRTILLAILLAAAPSLLAVLWLCWRTEFFGSDRNKSAPAPKKQDAVANEVAPGSATEFPIAPEVPSAAPTVRRPRRRAAARA